MEKIKLSDSSELQLLIKKYSPFLKEAKKRLMTSLVVFLATSVIGFVLYEQIIAVLIGVLSLQGINIVFTSPFQFISLAFSCGLVCGLLVTFPLLIYQLLGFFKPALKIKEYALVVRAIPFSILLFIIGFVFGTILMKWQIEIFLNRSVALQIGNILDISSLLSTVFVTSALMGLGFQFPVVLLILRRLGVIRHRQLTQKRKWIYLGSFVFALFLPPDSILADVILALPLIILYEITLIIDKVYGHKK